VLGGKSARAALFFKMAAKLDIIEHQFFSKLAHFILEELLQGIWDGVIGDMIAVFFVPNQFQPFCLEICQTHPKKTAVT